MATQEQMPVIAYCMSSMQDHRRKFSLGTILEEEEESPRSSFVQRGRSGYADWKSPMSENFPTPRANQFAASIQREMEGSGSDSDDAFPTPKRSTFNNVSKQHSAGLDTAFPTPRGKNFLHGSTYGFSNGYSSDEDVSTDIDDDALSVEGSESIASSDSDAGEIASQTSNDSCNLRPSSRMSFCSSHSSIGGALSDRITLPTITIPQSINDWASISSPSKYQSPIPPTPPGKVPISPAVLEFLSSRGDESPTALPSLDGSLTSEQLAQLSAPDTPCLSAIDDTDADNWNGVRLDESAMDTLRTISGDEEYETPIEQIIDFEDTDHAPMREMQQSSVFPAHGDVSRGGPYPAESSWEHLNQSDSSNDFAEMATSFNSQSYRQTRREHGYNDTPPSTTTAEHFYSVPWSQQTGHQIDGGKRHVSRPSLDAQGSDEMVKIGFKHEPEEQTPPGTEVFTSPAAITSIISDVELDHEERTSLWSKAHTNYLAPYTNDGKVDSDEPFTEKQVVEGENQPQNPPKKTVRFTTDISGRPKLFFEEVQDGDVPRPKRLVQDSAYYRSFLDFVTKSRGRDAHVHRLPRLEALQAQRATFPESHRNQLLGKFQLSVIPQSAKKRLSINVIKASDAEEDPGRLRRDQDLEAHDQMNTASWTVMASQFLNGGHLIIAPIASRLKHRSLSTDASSRPRILDLGGQSVAGWAWHCAFAYPGVQVTTLTTHVQRRTANANIRGPQNHHTMTVEGLTTLPFPDAHFDLISARTLHTFLRTTTSSEHGSDEYATCLSECQRVLKPGGYIEFSVMDSDLVNAGPLGQAKNVEFGFILKSRGYDPFPTRCWLKRLNRAGFVHVKRAWVVLPAGVGDSETKQGSSSGTSRQDEESSHEAETSMDGRGDLYGSTKDIATITSLAAGWAWEKWLAKLQVEIGGEGHGKWQGSLLDGVWDVCEESRKYGTCWRGLSGWARKS